MIQDYISKNPYPGKFVCLEGVDGSGKSEQFKMLRHQLPRISSGNFIFTKEPTYDETGRLIYDILRGYHPTIKFENLSDLEIQRYYFLNRKTHYQDLVLPALRAGAHVISDRGLASIAYGIKNINDLEKFISIERGIFDREGVEFLVPDKILIFDVDGETAISRLEKKQRPRDKFEEISKIELARQNYLTVAKEIPNCEIIDGMSPAKDIFPVTLNHVLALLNK